MKKAKKEYEELREIVAACGLDCKKCLSHVDGEIGKHSRELRRLLGSFDGYAERFASFRPEFKRYPEFKALLDLFAEPACHGCRSGECQNPHCVIGRCSREKGVDYCFQCMEFPCDKPAAIPHLHKRWLKMNKRMQEIGVEAYYEETKDQPRYV